MQHKGRGRPRSHREKVDKGTLELQQKKQTLLDNRRTQDPSLAESLLGILYARDLISKPLYEAGRCFEEVGYKYTFCLGYAFRKRINALSFKWGDSREERDSPLSDLEAEKRTKAWRNALGALQHAGASSYQIVLKVVFCDQDLHAHPFSPPPLKEIEALRKGLNLLDKYFKGEFRGERDTPHDSAPCPLRPTKSPQLLKEPPRLSLPQHLAQVHHAP